MICLNNLAIPSTYLRLSVICISICLYTFIYIYSYSYIYIIHFYIYIYIYVFLIYTGFLSGTGIAFSGFPLMRKSVSEGDIF